MSAAIKYRPYQDDTNDGIEHVWRLKPLAAALAVLPTGAGKTVVFSRIIKNHNEPCVAIAHREELVSQMSCTLAREGVYHRIIAPEKVIRSIVKKHMKKFGRSFYNASAQAAVAGVDTLMSRKGTGDDGDIYTQKRSDGTFIQYGPRVNGKWGLGVVVEEVMRGSLTGKLPPKDIDPVFNQFAQTVTLWILDEAHHALRINKWGKAAALFPRAKGLGVTATPERADGFGLGRHADGIFDQMYVGPSLLEMVRMGYLVNYRIFVPKSDLDLDQVAISKTTGDRNVKQLAEVTGKSSLVVAKDGAIIGDIVSEYLRVANGKLGITFMPSIATAEEVARQFNDNGVPALVVHGKSTDEERTSAIEKFERREVLQLINVDLFGEGTDLPNVEVISMGRRTESFSLFVQQAGRALRLLISDELMAQWDDFTDEQRRYYIAQSDKPFALIIDHVGNVERHAKLIRKNGEYIMDLCRREWTLDRRDKRYGGEDDPDIVPSRNCLNEACCLPYDRSLLACPHCGVPPPPPKPQERSDPEFVDGDLFELDQAVLAKLYEEQARFHVEVGDKGEKLQGMIEDYRRDQQLKHTRKEHELANVKRFAQKMEKQLNAIGALKDYMAWWAGYHRADGRTDREIFKLFYLKFGVTWLGAQALPTEDADKLAERVLLDTGVL